MQKRKPKMPRTAFTLLAGVCLLLAGAMLITPNQSLADEKTAETQAVELRLTSYNIRHGRGMDNVVDLERIARVVMDTKPNLIALQEVDVRTQRTNRVDQAGSLGELTGKHHTFGKAIDFQGGEYGNAVLSRWAFADTQNLPLPGEPGREARAAIFATVKVPGLDEPLTYISMHLCHQSREDRLAQIQAIIDKVKTLGHPAVLVGDLNAVPGTEEYDLATGFFADLVPDNREGTFSSTDPRRRIDYFLFHPGERFTLVEYEVIPEEVASDHRPLRMTVRLSGQ